MKTDLGLLILRVTTGLMMMGHGFGKVGKVLQGDFQFADPLGIGPTASLILAAFAEFFCALAVVVGLKVRWAAVPPLITMLVAAFGHHAADPWGDKEFPLLYAAVFLALTFTGGGKYALDARIKRRKR